MKICFNVRRSVSIAAVVAITVIRMQAANAGPVKYEFKSLFSIATGFPSAGFSFPSINNKGIVAVQTFDGLFTHDGSTATFITDFVTSGFNSGGPWINDHGAIAGEKFGAIVRINPDGSITTLATLKGDGTGDFRGLSSFLVSMNNLGQAAAHVQTNDFNFAIVRLDDTGPTVIDTQDVNVRFNFTGPGINDFGVVAYKAAVQVPDPAPNHNGLFTGTGGPVKKEGTFPPTGSSGVESRINNAGLVAGTEPGVAITAKDGAITIVGDGTTGTSPYLSFDRLALNNFGEVAFAARKGATSKLGLYTGNDPVNNKVIEVGDTVLGGVVSDIRFFGGGFNDLGQIVFLMQTGNQFDGTVSHVVLATPSVTNFLCYNTSDKQAIDVTLEDQLDGPASYEGKQAKSFCTPAPRVGNLEDPDTHLKAYQIKGPHAPRTNVRVDNQFGTLFFDTVKTELLMVPASKSLPPDDPPGPPDPGSEVDHYRCLKVKVNKNICQDDPDVQCKTNSDCSAAGLTGPCNKGFPKGFTLAIDDQFGNRELGISAPSRLCIPTDKNGEGIKDTEKHLMCYKVKTEPKTSVDSVQVNDQFGPEVLDLKKEAEFCVPSKKTLT